MRRLELEVRKWRRQSETRSCTHDHGLTEVEVAALGQALAEVGRVRPIRLSAESSRRP